jgi:4-diphosphocytidyl-2C-methyl-D-erythritol kinase
LSGTGSTVFMEYQNLEAAQLAKEQFPELVLTKSLERSPLMQIIE